jgi:hypothetical protein
LEVCVSTQYDASERWTGEDFFLQKILPLTKRFFCNEEELKQIAKANPKLKLPDWVDRKQAELNEFYRKKNGSGGLAPPSLNE